MNWKEKLQVAWQNRAQIKEGFYNLWISQNLEVQSEIKRRKDICESNICGYYQPEGTGDNVILTGKPACGICGCNIPAKPACMSCTCSLADIGQDPLWTAVMSQEQEDHIRQTIADKRAAYEEHQRNKKQQ